MGTVIENTDYELELLKNLSYSFYPKGICAMNNSAVYQNTAEYLLLSQLIKKHNNSFLKTFIDDFKNLSTAKLARDVTRFSWLDRSYNLQLTEVKDNYLVSICLNISILIPYYALYVIEVQLQKGTQDWLTLPKKLDSVEEKMHQEELDMIEALVQQNLNLKKLPTLAYSTFIENINFQDKPMGEFSIFNAFFLNDITVY